MNINNKSNKNMIIDGKTSSLIKSSLLFNNNKSKNINNQSNVESPVRHTLQDKFICLFCNSVHKDFFYCDCINEFIIKNIIFFEEKIPSKISKDNNCNYKGKNNFPNNYNNLDFFKIKKNFLQNFLNYYKENENSKKLSLDFLTDISLFFQEDIAKDSFRLLNACKDLTSFPQKEPLITLYDLFDYFTAEEKLREEKIFCLTCNDWISRVKRLEINKFPKILIINFKRFRYDIIQPKARSTRRALDNNANSFNVDGNFNSNKLNFGGEKNENKIDFPFDLDLTKFNRYGESIKYELYAVCNHEGKISGGHYKAICKDFQSNKWFEFDDKIVKQINQNTIVSHKAYILFYRRKKE
jgi:hypothetical protein